MRCPVVTDGKPCGGHLRTIDSRESPRAGKRRRRECTAGHRTTWYEFQVDDVASAEEVVEAVFELLRPRVFALLDERRLCDPRAERLVAALQAAQRALLHAACWCRDQAAPDMIRGHCELAAGDVARALDAAVPGAPPNVPALVPSFPIEPCPACGDTTDHAFGCNPQGRDAV